MLSISSRSLCSSRPKESVNFSRPSTYFSRRLIRFSNLVASCIAHLVTCHADFCFWFFLIRLLNRSKESLKIFMPTDVETSDPRPEIIFNPYLSSTLSASCSSSLMLLSMLSSPGRISCRSIFSLYGRRRPSFGFGIRPTDSPQSPNRVRCNAN